MPQRDASGRFVSSGGGSAPTVTMNPRLAEELNADPLIQLLCREYALAALNAARSIYPVKTGRSRAALDLYDVPGHAPALVTWSSKWHWIEYGTTHTPPHAPLRRGVEATGCKYVDVRGGSDMAFL